MRTSNSIGKKILYFRKKRNITRKKLVKGICDESTLFRIEKGDNIPSLYIIEELCDKMSIPISMLFDEKIINYGNDSSTYLRQRCRELVYQRNYLKISFLLNELKEKIYNNVGISKEDVLFVIWHEAIVLHEVKGESKKAKKLLLKHIPQTAILETELSMLNSLGLIYKSLGQKQEACHYFEIAYEGMPFNKQYDDPTLPIRVGYNYASQLFYEEEYLRVIDIMKSSKEYLDMNYLLYKRGRTHHLLAKAYEKLEKFSAAKIHMQMAIEIFTIENKCDYKDKSFKDLKVIKSKKEKAVS